ncbi:hypothetical protein [Paenarthrobacter aurescens]|uniref:hypothetical protein n=1 Tax=Paenarthrobacter aurescens TaxID=43663 RepID=UPI0035EA39F8
MRKAPIVSPADAPSPNYFAALSKTPRRMSELSSPAREAVPRAHADAPDVVDIILGSE